MKGDDIGVRNPGELRIIKALREVQQQYKITSGSRGSGGDTTMKFLLTSLTRSSKKYEVVFHEDWSLEPYCSCPDHTHRGVSLGGWCKHAIAVAMLNESLKCQILDLLLN